MMRMWNRDPMVIELMTAGGRRVLRPVYCRFETEGILRRFQARTSGVGERSRGLDLS